MNKNILKKEGEELRQYLIFRRKGTRVESKKGKASFHRKPKYGLFDESE